MSIQIPTTTAISNTIIAQLESDFNQTIPLLPKAFNRVLAKVLGAVFVLMYKYGGFIFLQMFVSKASADETTINGTVLRPLVEWGRLIGVGDPVGATAAELTVDVTVTSQVGTLPAGSQMINSTNGVTYLTIGAVALDAAVVEVTIRAVADQAGGDGSGAIGNLEVDDIVSFANPLANVMRDAVVTAQTETGADAEDIENYRQRVIDRFQRRPQGGAYADYEVWGEEVAGIVNVYPYTGEPGEVNVYVEASPASSGDPDGIPTAAQLEDVYDAIQLDSDGLATRRPANAFVNVLPITRTAFDVTVSGLVVDNEDQVQDDIEAAVLDFFLQAEPYIDGLTIPPRKDRITRSSLIALIDSVVSDASGSFLTASFTLAGDPDSIEIYVLDEGEKAKCDTVTFE